MGIAIGCLNTYFFTQNKSVWCLRYAKFHEYFKNGLDFKYSASFTSQIRIIFYHWKYSFDMSHGNVPILLNIDATNFILISKDGQ